MRRRGVEVGKLEPPLSSSTETLLPLGTCLCFLGDECRIRGCGALGLTTSISRELIKLVRKLDAETKRRFRSGER